MSTTAKVRARLREEALMWWKPQGRSVLAYLLLGFGLGLAVAGAGWWPLAPLAVALALQELNLHAVRKRRRDDAPQSEVPSA